MNGAMLSEAEVAGLNPVGTTMQIYSSSQLKRKKMENIFLKKDKFQQNWHVNWTIPYSIRLIIERNGLTDRIKNVRTK
jgi:hypothetical protein